ncbi:MAG: hypothetical protein RL661_722 [Pseudomonadota bacterium]
MLLHGCTGQPHSPLEAARIKNQSAMEQELAMLGPLTYTQTTLLSKQAAQACAEQDGSREDLERNCRPFLISAEINARKDEYAHTLKVQRIEQKYALMNMDLEIQKAKSTPIRGSTQNDLGGDWSYTGDPGGLGTKTPSLPEIAPTQLEPINQEQLEIEQAHWWNQFLRFLKD